MVIVPTRRPPSYIGSLFLVELLPCPSPPSLYVASGSDLSEQLLKSLSDREQEAVNSGGVSESLRK